MEPCCGSWGSSLRAGKGFQTGERGVRKAFGKEARLEAGRQIKKVLKWSSLMSQTVKNPSAMWKTQVQFLGWEDPLEKGMATHSSVLA